MEMRGSWDGDQSLPRMRDAFAFDVSHERKERERERESCFVRCGKFNKAKQGAAGGRMKAKHLQYRPAAKSTLSMVLR